VRASRVLVAGVVIVVLAAGLIVALQLDGSGHGANTPLGAGSLSRATPAAVAVSTPDATPDSTSVTTPVTPAASKAASAAERRARAERAVRAIVAARPAGSVSLAAADLATGTRFTAGATSGMWTASVYKLLALETLLLQHQRTGIALSSQERSDAAAAIEHSDNKAGYRLFLDAGGNIGLAAGIRALGMRHTVLGSTDPTFTRIDASAGLRLLDALTGASPLDTASRRYVLGLMRRVEADQRWGVGVVADPGSVFANKNGWLEVDDSNPAGETDDDRWIVDSLGIVTVHGHRLLMAVLTQHNEDYDSGIRLVQRLARLLARAVR
jgi:hypothetical protein